VESERKKTKLQGVLAENDGSVVVQALYTALLIIMQK